MVVREAVRVGDRLRSTLMGRALLIYGLSRAFVAVVILAVAPHQERMPPHGRSVGYFDMANLWDGQWFGQIAAGGYPSELPLDPETGEVAQNEWGFAPAFPFLVRALTWLTRIPFEILAPSVALACGFGAVAMMVVLLRERLGNAPTLGAVVVFSFFPSSPALQIAYSDSLALLLVCVALWALTRERWLVVAVVAPLIGLTRMVALPLVVVICVALALRWRRRSSEPLQQRELGAGALALLGGLVGGVMMPVLAWWWVGEPSAYAETMAAWRPGDDIVPLQLWLRAAQTAPGFILLVLLVLPLLWATLGSPSRQLGPVLRGWCVAYGLYLIAVNGPVSSGPRHLLLLFPLAAVILGAAANTKPVQDLRAKVIILVAVCLPAQVWWVWGLLRFVPPADSPP